MTEPVANLAASRLSVASTRLPWLGLLALAMAGFITILTEALPAGLLPQMSSSLTVSEALTGQLVTVYALGSLVAAIPLTLATRAIRRRLLLLAAIVGFLVVNTVTAISANYGLTLVARFFAGVSAGLLWALLAGYAARMAPAHLKGRAIAVAMAGTPLALSLGIPAGTFLGSVVGWRASFGVMSVLTLILIFWVMVKVPDFPGQTDNKTVSPLTVISIPGIGAVLLVTFTFVLAHNILYTYIAPFLTRAGMAGTLDAVLLLFGVTALISIWLVGVLVDRWLRELALVSTVLFGVAALILCLWGRIPLAIDGAVGLWGLSFGGAATLFQTASANAAGDAADVAQSMIVTVWNAAIAGGGIVGGALLAQSGAGAFPWALVALLAIAFTAAFQSRDHGFPASREHGRGLR